MIDEKILDKELLERYNKLVEEDNLLPIKISKFYMKKLLEEIDAIGKATNVLMVRGDVVAVRVLNICKINISIYSTMILFLF